MKLEIKLIFTIVAILIIANPLVMNAKGIDKGDAGFKDPIIALILSLVIPGLGHIWLGETTKGIIYFAIYVGIWVLASILLYTTLGLGFFIAPLIAFAWAVYVAFDAMKAAKRYNERGGKLSMVDNYHPDLITAN